MAKIGYHTTKFIKSSCLDQAIKQSGMTLEQILADIEKEKAIEEMVMELSKKHYHYETIARKVGISGGKVSHIIKFDALGLTYRKINQKQNHEAKVLSRI